MEEVKYLLEVLSHEAGVDLLAYLSTVAARQTADFSTKVWSHLLCDADDYDIPDLCQTFFRRALIRSKDIDSYTIYRRNPSLK